MTWKDEALALLPAVPHALRLGVEALGLIPWAPTGPDTALRAAARLRPASRALAYGARTWSWRLLHEDVDRHASALRRAGVRAGDRVALLIDNRPEFVILFHALNRLGAAAALINTSLTGSSLAHAVRAGDVSRIIVGAEHAAALAELRPGDRSLFQGAPVHVVPDEDSASMELPDPESTWLHPDPIGATVPLRVQHNKEVACYIYTSGTTGLPKAAVMRNQRVIGAGEIFGRLMHQATADDVIYVTLPLYHTSALCLGWGACLATGASMALRRRFSASRFWDDVVAYGATTFLYIGEVCRYLVQSPPHPLERAHGLRAGIGNGVRIEVAEAFRERFAVPVMREFYGSTEGNAFCLNVEGVPGMIGRLAPGMTIVRCDPTTGELERGPDGWCVEVEPGDSGLLIGRINPLVTFDGYADTAATDRKILTDVFKEGDAWFNTGDLIQRHERFWMSFVDRLGDTYRWKGENISTTEVGALLGMAPGVVECVVYGVQVPGSEGRAGMVALVAGPDFTMEAFEAYVREQVPRLQQPRFVRLLEGQIETTGTFKLRKVDYQREGLDLTQVHDPIHALLPEGYARLTSEHLSALEAGTLTVP